MKKGLILSVLLAAFVPSLSWATFDVFDERSEGYYGNAETRRFKDDVDGTDVLSARDRAYLDSVSVNRITQRWYIRALIGNERTKMQEVHNNSSHPYNNVILTGGTVTKNLMQLLVAGGYLWEHWAIEGELFFSKLLNYNQNFIYPSNVVFPVTPVNPIVQAQSRIQQVGLLINIQYIIPRYFDFYPQHLQLHLDAGVGPNVKTTNTKTYTPGGTPLLNGSANTLAWMAKLAAGGRYQITTHFLVDIAYAYLFLGKTSFGPVGNSNATNNTSGTIKFQSPQMQSNGWWFGLTYQV